MVLKNGVKVPFRLKRSTHAHGWMGILLSGEHHDMHWRFMEHITNVSYHGNVYDFGQDKFVTIRHPFAQSTDFSRISGGKMVLSRVVKLRIDARIRASKILNKLKRKSKFRIFLVNREKYI
mgnify:CR=1 FL=1